MKKTAIQILALAFSLLAVSAVDLPRINSVPVVPGNFPSFLPVSTAPNGSDVIVLWDGSTNRYASITNAHGDTIVLSNLYATNIYVTNLYASNFFATNIYTSTNIFVSEFTTNLYVSNNSHL